jgi:hypothetical protein
VPEQFSTPYEDEISLTELFGKLWRRRGVIAAAVFFSGLLGALAVLLQSKALESESYLFIDLVGIEKNRYPNGSLFSPTDLKAPEVLDQLVKQFELESRQALSRALSVEYGSPLAYGLIKKFEARLDSAGKDVAAIEAITNAFDAELAAVQASTLKVSLNHRELGVTSAVSEAIVERIPRLWSTLYTTKYRVLQASGLDSLSISRANISMENTAAVLNSRDVLSRLQSGAETLARDKRLETLTTESGYSAADLISESDRFRRLFFEPIFTGLFEKSDQVSRSFVRETQLKIDEISRNIKSLDSDINDLKGFQNSGARSVTNADVSGSATVQLTDNTLDQVLELSRQASLSSYLTEVLTKRRSLQNQRSALFKDIARTQSSGFSVEADFINVAESELQTIVNEYIELVGKAREQQQRAINSFYIPLGVPATDEQFLTERWQLIVALSIVLGVMLGCLVALVLPTNRQSVSSEN